MNKLFLSGFLSLVVIGCGSAGASGGEAGAAGSSGLAGSPNAPVSPSEADYSEMLIGNWSGGLYEVPLGFSAELRDDGTYSKSESFGTWSVSGAEALPTWSSPWVLQTWTADSSPNASGGSYVIVAIDENGFTVRGSWAEEEYVYEVGRVEE